MTAINLHYITVATKPHMILDLIKTRVENQSEIITILGLHENRNIGWQAKANFGVKLKEVYYYIWNSKLHQNDIVLFTDAYDVIYCGNVNEIVKRFLKFDRPIVFGCEKNCSPDPQRHIEYSYKDTEFPYLNSGLYIGRVWALRQLMVGYSYDDTHDDQRYWTTHFLKNPDLITLDYNNSLFLNTSDVKVTDIKYDGVNAHYKDKNPLFIHVNGPDKSDLMYFLRK